MKKITLSKLILITIILWLMLFLIPNNTMAYDLDNPKLPSERTYTAGDYVTITVNGMETAWHSTVDCDSDTEYITLVYDGYATQTDGTVTFTHDGLSKAENNIGTWLAAGLTDTTGFICTSLSVDVINEIINRMGCVPQWLINCNYWTSTPNGTDWWVINAGSGWGTASGSVSGIYGYKPYIAISKSNINGRYKATVDSLKNGSITLSTDIYDENEKVIVTVKPNTGYKLTEGTLQYNSSVAIGQDSQGNYAYLGPAQDTAITASFELIQYNITYVDSQNADNPNPTTYTYSSKKAITLQDLVKEGNTFEGWYSDPEYNTKVTSIAKKATGDKTFYAKWAIEETDEPTYIITIPTEISVTERTGTFSITATNIEDLTSGSINITLTYPADGFKLTNEYGDIRNMNVYKGTSADETNKITSSSSIVASFTANGSQSIYYSIEEGNYPGVYTGKLTFTSSYVKGE